MGCIVFELATGDLLFDPHSSSSYERDEGNVIVSSCLLTCEDHLAQIIELLGEPSQDYCLTGKYSQEFFDKKGKLKHIKDLKFWGIESVLVCIL